MKLAFEVPDLESEEALNVLRDLGDQLTANFATHKLAQAALFVVQRDVRAVAQLRAQVAELEGRLGKLEQAGPDDGCK